MSRFKVALYYIWGAIQFSLALTIILAGSMQFVITIFTGVSLVESGAFLGIHVPVIIFVLELMVLIMCGLLYHVNPTLWNKVHKSREENKEDILRLIPDLFLMVSFIFELGFYNSIK